MNYTDGTCLEIFGAKPPSSPTLHSCAPYFSVITACLFNTEITNNE